MFLWVQPVLAPSNKSSTSRICVTQTLLQYKSLTWDLTQVLIPVNAGAYNITCWHQFWVSVPSGIIHSHTWCDSTLWCTHTTETWTSARVCSNINSFMQNHSMKVLSSSQKWSKPSTRLVSEELLSKGSLCSRKIRTISEGTGLASQLSCC